MVTNTVEKRYYRIRHIGENGEHLTHDIKIKWINEAEALAEKCGNKFSVQCVSGEFRSIYVIEEALKKPYCGRIEAIFGSKLLDEDIKSRLKKILSDPQNDDKVKVYTTDDLLQRPPYHVVRIDNHYLYEDPHEPFTLFEYATVIPHGNRDDEEYFNKYFNKIRDQYCKRIYAKDIVSIPTLITPEVANSSTSRTCA